MPGGLFAILSKLSDNLYRLGQPWGSDEMGKQFSQGASGYSAAVDSLVGNASPGPDASGAIPVFGQLLVNYGTTIREAGKAFGAGEDLYAEWMLKNYVDEDASGNPGPYKGPLSSDPNHGKNGGNNNTGNNDAGNDNPTGPPASTQNQGNGGGQNPAGPGKPDIGGPNAGAPKPGGSNPGGSSSGGSDVGGPPLSNYTAAGTPALSLNSSSGDPLGDITSSGSVIDETPIGQGVNAIPGAIGPNGYRPTDPTIGAPVDKSGAPVTGGGGKGVGGGPLGRVTDAAYDGEKLAPKGGASGVPMRAGVPANGMMPGMPGVPPGAGAGAGAPANGKEKRQERRKPPPAEEVETEPEATDPWRRSGWRVGGQ